MKILIDKPLLQYTIETAKKSRFIDSILCSTDDEKILNFSKKHGCNFVVLRDSSLTRDDVNIFHVVKKLKKFTDEYDYVVILQPTSPLRNADDIDNTIKLCHKSTAVYATTVSKLEINPFVFSKKSKINLSQFLIKLKDVPKKSSILSTELFMF